MIFLICFLVKKMVYSPKHYLKTMVLLFFPNKSQFLCFVQKMHQQESKLELKQNTKKRSKNMRHFKE